MFHKGNFLKEQDERGGWFYGSFMPDGIQKDNRAEVKIFTHKKGFSNNYHYQKTVTKIDLILEGSVIWEIEGEDVKLGKGDYVIIPPNVKAKVKKIISDIAVVQTIKLPSIPEDRVEVKS